MAQLSTPRRGLPVLQRGGGNEVLSKDSRCLQVASDQRHEEIVVQLLLANVADAC